MRIGMYGGTFDPVHHGHLILARDALEQLGLDRVVFIPATINPHKLYQHPAPPEARYGMIKAAIAGEPRFDVSDIEIKREGPSFTIDTVHAFRALHPDAVLFYIIGQDNLPDLNTWRSIEELRKLVQFVVLARGDRTAEQAMTVSARRFDISASEIRRRVANGQSIQYLVPEAVRAMIEAEKLYKELRPSTRKL